jgi:hypothetical protein
MADDRRGLDPALLTPLTLEVLTARDEILAVLDRLSDDRKRGMALTYAGATWATGLAEAHGADLAKCAQKVAFEIVRVALDGVIPHAVIGPPKGSA